VTCHPRNEFVEERDHLGARLRPVRRFRYVQPGLVTGPHEHMRERPHWLLADATQCHPVGQQNLHHAEHMLLAQLLDHPAEVADEIMAAIKVG